MDHIQSISTILKINEDKINYLCGKNPTAIMQADESQLKDMKFTKKEIERIFEFQKINHLLWNYPRQEKQSMNAPEKIASYFMQSLRFKQQEEMHIILIDTRGNLKKTIHMYTGTIDGSYVRVSEILSIVLKNGSHRFAIVHNHPSGDPTPSGADLDITKAIKNASEIVNIDFIDHIIIGDNCYYSIKEHDLM